MTNFKFTKEIYCNVKSFSFPFTIFRKMCLRYCIKNMVENT